jgi:hypothetical protein
MNSTLGRAQRLLKRLEDRFWLIPKPQLDVLNTSAVSLILVPSNHDFINWEFVMCNIKQKSRNFRLEFQIQYILKIMIYFSWITAFIIIIIIIIILFWWDWSSNSRLHTCKTGALPLVLLVNFALGILDMGTICPDWPRTTILLISVVNIIGMNYWHQAE